MALSYVGQCSAQQNRLIRALPLVTQQQLVDRLECVRLTARQILNRSDEPITYVYFPYDAVLSVLIAMEDGATVEGAVIGNQGIVGLSVFLGGDTATDEVAVQISGSAGRMSASTFRDLVSTNAPLQEVLYRYALALMYELARTAGCNRLHSVRQRCARRLLVGRDLAGNAGYALTHETLANLLGVRRASVTEAAEALQQAGMIEYRRGWINIVDPLALETAACEDYRSVRSTYEQIGPDRSSASSGASRWLRYESTGRASVRLTRP